MNIIVEYETRDNVETVQNIPDKYQDQHYIYYLKLKNIFSWNTIKQQSTT